MKHLLLLAALFAASILPGAEPLPVTAGVPPVANLVARIGGDRVRVSSALPVGRSPHDYAPTPREIRSLARSRLFLHTDMPFEQNLLRMLGAAKVPAVDVTRGVERRPLEQACDHDHDDGHAHDGHSPDSLDPHVWLATANLKIMADNIAAELGKLDPEGRAVYERNRQALHRELDQLHAELSTELEPYRGRAFYVHHAAFGYFAHETGLRQLAVELGGREPSPRHLSEVAKQARKDQIKVIFVQPQFNPGAARALAETTGARVSELDPLAADAPANLRQLGRTLKESFQ